MVVGRGIHRAHCQRVHDRRVQFLPLSELPQQGDQVGRGIGEDVVEDAIPQELERTTLPRRTHFARESTIGEGE